MERGLWGWWVGMMGGGNRSGRMMGDGITKSGFKAPLVVHMEGSRGGGGVDTYFYPVSYIWMDPARKSYYIVYLMI